MTYKFNSELTRQLHKLADNSTNQFKSRAFDIAANNIGELNYKITEKTIARLENDIADGKIKGIGVGIMSRIVEFCENGIIYDVAEFDAIDNAIEELSKIRGIGRATATRWVELGIRNIGDLRKSIKNKEITPTTSQKYSILYHNDLIKPIPRDTMIKIISAIQRAINVDVFEAVGSYRRGASSSGDIDILIITKKSMSDVIRDIANSLNVIAILEEGGESATILICYKGVVRQCDILIATQSNYVASLVYFTGSKEHNIALRKRAKTLGYKLNQNGLYKNNRAIPLKTEHDLYAKLGIKYCEPKNRDYEINLIKQ
jgi:DNA polymerase/3'-5' exonuclease PolX